MKIPFNFFQNFCTHFPLHENTLFFHELLLIHAFLKFELEFIALMIAFFEFVYTTFDCKYYEYSHEMVNERAMRNYLLYLKENDSLRFQNYLLIISFSLVSILL